jgi:xylose isomerase
MRMYLLLKERAADYRADPAVQEAMAAAGVLSLAEPTLNPGETMADLRGDLAAYEEFDPDSPGGRGYGFVRLNQLAVDHLLGAR